MSDLMMAIGGQTAGFIAETMDAGEQQAFGRLFAISFADEGVEQWCQIDPIPKNDQFYGVTNGPVFFGGSMYHNDSQAQRIINFHSMLRVAVGWTSVFFFSLALVMAFLMVCV